MDGSLKTAVGWLVGKLVFTAQLIPITTPDLLRKCSAWFFYPKALRKQLANAWQNFNAFNEIKGADQKLDLKRYFVDVPEQFLQDPTQSDQAKSYKISTAKLDTIELCHPDHQSSQNYIIYVWGRSDCYEKRLNRLAEEALNLKAHIISFNLRGVGHSTNSPKSQMDVAADLLAQVDRLTEKLNIPPENILIHGHSLGGGVEILTKGILKRREAMARAQEDAVLASALPQRPPRYKVRNDRSFRSLLDVSCHVNFVNRRTRRSITRFFATLLSALILLNLALFNVLSILSAGLIFAGVVASTRWQFTYKIWNSFLPDILHSGQLSLMKYSNWVMEVADLWESFDESEKSYMVIRQPHKRYSPLGLGRKYKIGHEKDKVIWPEFTLHRGLTITKDKIAELRDRLSKKLSAVRNLPDGRAEPGVCETLCHEIQALQYQIIELKNVSVTGGGHGDDPKCFLTRYEDPTAKRHITGQEQWFDFAEPTEGHKAEAARAYKNYGFQL